MILINVNKTELAKRHLEALRDEVNSKIEIHYTKFKNDSNFLVYKNLLEHLQKRLNILLIGDLNELSKIIDYIEKNIYISSQKLSLLLKKRAKEGVTAKANTLRGFIQINHLEPYLSEIRTNEYTNLDDFKSDIDKLMNNQILTENITKKKITFEEALNEVFSYKDFSDFKKDRKNAWDAYEYTSYLNVDVCPYCDRQFTFTFINFETEKRARAVLDHFYSKSLYPYLAISIFNLIPCCHICNSTFKLNRDLYKNEILYPFEDQFKNNVKFIITPNTYNAFIGLDADLNIDLQITTTDNALREKISNSIELFALKEIYTAHNIYVKNLIRNIYINSPSRISELYAELGEIFNDKDELEKALYLGMGSEENLGKHVLSKITYDVINQFKVD